MLQNIRISVSRETRKVYLEESKIGNDNENLQGKFIFAFKDEFVDGIARLEYVLPNSSEKYYQMLTKTEESYEIPIKSVITKEGRLFMQLVITQSEVEEEIPIFKSNVFYVYVDESINAQAEQPEEYPTWLEIANSKLADIDEAIQEVSNLNIEANKEGTTTTVTITDKDGVEHTTQILDGTNGIDGQDGTDGFSPVASVTKSGDTATISITDKEGTTTTTISDGKDGKDGQPGASNTLTIGTVQTGATSSATITGESPNQVLNLVLEKGETGSTGSPGQDGYSPTASVSKSGSTATITITDKNGTTTTEINDGTNGINGTDGVDGYSPVASVSKVGDTSTITITDKNGTTTANVFDGQVIQYSTMPTASADYLSKIVQYTGTTTSSYTNGYFYVCTSTESDEVTTYSWENIQVQAGGQAPIYVITGTTTANIEILNTCANKFTNGEPFSLFLKTTFNPTSSSTATAYVPINFHNYYQGTGYTWVTNYVYATNQYARIRLLASGTWGSFTNMSIYNDGKFTVVREYGGTLTTQGALVTNNSNSYTPTSDYHPATKKYVDDAVAGAGGSGTPDNVTTRLNSNDELETIGIYTTQDSARKIWEGTLQQYNAIQEKDSSTYYYITDDADSINEVPNGGTTGQVLGKNSSIDNDTTWLDKRNPVQVTTDSGTTYTISSLGGNQSYKLGTLTSLTISAISVFDEESIIYFASGSTATSITVPTTLVNIGDVPELTNGTGTCNASKSYIIAILNNIAVWKEY